MALPLTVSEFFAGIGLVRMGLEAAGWRVVFANDFAPKKFKMYDAFYPGSSMHYVVKDVFHLDPKTVPGTTLATCSFPCIDLSVAGNMGGINGKHSSAFWGFIRVLGDQGEAAPPLLLVENVPGWLNSNEGNDFALTVRSLNSLGYVCDVFTLDALRFTPQSRLRVFLVASRLHEPTAEFSSFLSRPRSLVSDTLERRVLANGELRWFAAKIPDPPDLLKAGLAGVVERLNDEDARWWSEFEVQRHLAMMKAEHRKMVQSLAESEQTSYRTFYRRKRESQQFAEVRRDDLAGCLRTAVGGSGKQFLIRAGGGRIRMRTMTPREYARLQGVPDSYAITVDGVQALTGFGDAVCVPAITWIGANVLNPIALAAP